MPTFARLSGAVYAMLVGAVFTATAWSQPVKLELLEVNKIWSGPLHAAFTDLVHYQGRFLCMFREGESHASPGGTIRVLGSEDGQAWSTVVVLEAEGIDLRDPKVSVMPDGRLQMIGGASFYAEDEEGVARVVRRHTFVSFSEDGETWTEPAIVGEDGDWLWRLTWHGETAYGVAYRYPESIRLLKTRDGLNYEQVGPVMMAEQAPNEATIRFDDDGTAYCLLRREGEPVDGGPRYTRAPAALGVSSPPYEQWTWVETSAYLGGPDLIDVDGQWIFGARTRLGPARMTLGHLDVNTGKLDGLLHLPSGGDTSYPGMVWHDGVLWVSYYSSHEGQSEIYFAKVAVTPNR